MSDNRPQPPAIAPTLQHWVAGQQPTQKELQQLLQAELADPQQAAAFAITAENGEEKIAARSRLFLKVYPRVAELCRNFSFPDTEQVWLTLWRLWLPLAMQLARARAELGRPLIQGILGGQGTGKTTLAAVLRLILEELSYSSASISLDDLYQSYTDRQQLQQLDPRLVWRGPPGTHDVEAGIKLLDNLRQPRPDQTLLLPRFDKSLHEGAGDRVAPVAIAPVDIVLFEGWFVGAQPIDERAFAAAPPPLQTAADRQFARDNNERLKAYLPLWQRLDRLLVLYPTDYRFSKQWRQEAEQKMRAQGKPGMSDAEIEKFVEYFWQALHPELFIRPLTRDRARVDLVVEINADHSPGCAYRPDAN